MSEDLAFFPGGTEQVAAGLTQNEIREGQHNNSAQNATA
jgi:hypothetical protein